MHLHGELVLDFANISPQTSILDLACGTGELAKLILAKNPQQAITGVDISPDMLAVAREKLQACPQVKLFDASVTALPSQDLSFDLIICANAFHYFENPRLALAEMKRVLKPNGQLVILDWWRNYWVLQLLNLLFEAIDPAYQRCYTPKELENLAIDVGFELIKDGRVRFGFIWELMAIVMEY